MKDLTNEQYGRWTVIGFSHKSGEGRNVRVHWWCKCDCGSEKPVYAASLTSGKSLSCGCLHKDNLKTKPPAQRKNAHRNHPEYKNWKSMRLRCYTASSASYKNYGEVGVDIDPAWDDFSKFLEDMGPKPSLEHTIDRIENDKGYCKSNCRWATPTEQVRNRSVTTIVEYMGESRPLAEWSELLDINYGTLKKRLLVDKMPVEEAFNKPVRKWIKKE